MDLIVYIFEMFLGLLLDLLRALFHFVLQVLSVFVGFFQQLLTLLP